MAKQSKEKYILSMAGEYGVCSELSKRGFNASITLGNMKAVDIMVFMEDKTYRRIEVKTSRKTRFVTGFFQKYYDKNMKDHPDFWILVHIIPSNDIAEKEKLVYYILTHKEMGEEQRKRNKMSDWYYVKGCDNVLLKNIEQFEGHWEKIK